MPIMVLQTWLPSDTDAVTWSDGPKVYYYEENGFNTFKTLGLRGLSSYVNFLFWKVSSTYKNKEDIMNCQEPITQMQ